MEVVNDTPLLLKPTDYDYLERSIREWIEQVEDARREQMKGIWEKAAKNYAGKAPKMQLPWQGASNAILNITQSHTDSIQARLYAAGATSDPVYLIRPASGEPITDGDGAPIVDSQKFALWWSEISKHVEKHEVNHAQAMEEATWLTALYGDSYIYVSWIKDEVMDVSVGPGGELIREPRAIMDQPVLTVLHPERVYLAPWEHDPQEARTVAFDFDLDEQDLLIKEKRKIYLKGRVEELKKLIAGRDEDPEGSRLQKALEMEGHYKEWGRDSEGKGLRALLDEQSGKDPSVESRALKMLKVFQRVDLDGDGIPEEIQFEAEKRTGTVAVARYSNLMHRRRPLIHFYYSRRPGSPNNLGVPEMLFNAQKILDNLIRDLINNNKVKNTKLFLSKVGSPIKKQSQIFPSRLLTVNDVEKDFKVIDLGSAGGVTGLQEISLIQMWAERLTGVTEANLGIQAKSRTPVGTTQALMEEGSKRLDRALDRQREAQAEMWMQVLCLYRQNGDPRKLAKIARIEEEDLPLFLQAWDAVTPQMMTELLHIKPEVSSNTFNRAQQKQELLTVMGQVQQWYEQLMLLASHAAAAVQVGDPSLHDLVLSMAKGGHKLMQQFLALHDEKEHDELNPDSLIKLLEGVTSIGGAQQPGDAGGSSPAEAAASATGNGADAGESGEAVGRPTPGLPRVPGPTNGAPDAGGGPA